MIAIAVELQELMVTGALFSVTTLPSSVVPNPEPLIVTWLPTSPVVAEREVISGGGVAAELIETLSNAAVARPEL